MRTAWPVILFFTFAFTGYKFAISSWGGVVYVYLGEDRSPAAVRNSRDFSEMSYRNLGAPVEAQLISEAEVEVRDGTVGIYLGNPLLKSSGHFEFACRVQDREGIYDRIVLTFMGVGISTSGDTAELVVEAPCESRDIAWALEPIWIPIEQVTRGPAENAEFETEGDQPVSIELKHMPGEWPPQWVLSQVKFYRASEMEGALVIDAQQMRSARASLLSFDTP